MRLQKAIKRIVALGIGATMLGATMLSATAAVDLASYPSPFVKTGKFDGIIVVGDQAKAEDVIGTADIISSLQYASTTATTTTTSATTAVTGDAYKIDTSGDKLNFLQNLSTVVDVIDADELEQLKSGEISNNKGTYAYNKRILLGNGWVEWSADSDASDDPALYLKIKQDQANTRQSGSEAIVYKVEFPTAIKSDIDSSRDLDDIDNKKINIFGREYTFINTEYTSAGRLTLELMGGAIQDTLEEGKSKTYTINNKNYEVKVLAITDQGTISVKFDINGEVSDELQEAETFTLSDKTEVGIRSLMPNEAGDPTLDQVEFYLGAQKVKIVDSVKNATSATNTVSQGTTTVAANEISDVIGDIVWSNTSSEVSISQIQFVWEGSDDLYVPVGGKLSEVVTDQDDIDWLGATQLDFEFTGVEYGKTETVKLAPSGSTKLKLMLTNRAGEKLNEDLFVTNSSDVLLGKATDKLLKHAKGDVVCDEYYFIVTRNKYSHLLQLKKIATSDSTVEIKDVESGNTEKISFDSASTATLYKDGYAYSFSSVNTPTGCITLGTSVNDAVGKNALGASVAAGTNSSFWTLYGAQILFNDTRSAGANGKKSAIGMIMYENQVDYQEDTDLSGSSRADTLNTTITISSSKITSNCGTLKTSSPWKGSTAATPLSSAGTSISLAWDSKDNFQSGYTKWGTYIECDTSGDQDTLTLTYNDKEANPQVYLTAGKTTTTTTTGGVQESVTVQRIEVGAAKLASEVTSAGAQNLILVGGPCANAIARDVMGTTLANCAAGFEEGKAKIKLYEQATGKVALVVAGYSGTDTRRAARVIANYGDYALSGAEVEVSGTSLTDIKVTKVA